MDLLRVETTRVSAIPTIFSRRGSYHSTEFRLAIIVLPFMWPVFQEFFRFCAREKKWWLLPLVILLFAFVAIIIFASSSGVVWSVYSK
jgi:hypothetical protein